MTGTESLVECRYCDGQGWFADHEDECYEDGACSCSGVQVQCHECNGTGSAGVKGDPSRVFGVDDPR